MATTKSARRPATMLHGPGEEKKIEMLRGVNHKAPIETFKYSIIYLMALFVVMLVDHYLFPVITL